PTGSGTAGNNMVQISGAEYDNHQIGGDGNVTRRIVSVDSNSANNRITTFLYDFRNRQTAIDGEIDLYQQRYFDNLNHIIKLERYDSNTLGHLIGRSETLFDDRSRVFRSIRYAVNPTSGAVGNALIENTWYDEVGHVLKSLSSGSQLFTKIRYDSLERTVI